MCLELDAAHAVPTAQNSGLAHKPFRVSNVLHPLAVDGRSHELVRVVLHVLLLDPCGNLSVVVLKHLHQIILPSKPCQHPGLNLRRITVNHHVTFRCEDGPFELACVLPPTRQVLEVELVGPTPPSRMRSAVRQGNRYHSSVCDTQQALGAGLLQRGLVAQPRSHKYLHPLIRVLGQRLEPFIALGHRQRQFTRCRADFCWWLDAKPAQQFCKLLVGHEVIQVGPGSLHQLGLALTHISKMRLQQRLVQRQHRLCKHPDGQVDELEFTARELGQ